MLVDFVALSLLQTLADHCQLALRVARSIVDNVEAVGTLAVETHLYVCGLAGEGVVDQLGEPDAEQVIQVDALKV